jgi:hypothetical protein
MRASTLGIVFFAIAGCAGGGDGDDGGPTPDAAVQQEQCGDGLCAASEVGNCTADCGGSTGAVCGNNTCDPGESNSNCPNDCQGALCGDGTCDMTTENSTNCPGDCGGNQGGTLNCNDQNTLLGCFACILDPATGCIAPFTEQACNECLGGGGGMSFCAGGAPDGVCDPQSEDNTICPEDCP